MRDSWRAVRTATFVTALFGMLLAGPVRATGSDGSAVIIDTDSSLVVVGGDVNPSAPITDNLVAAGGRIVVDQPVGGHAVLAGGSIDLRAPIGGKLRAAGGSVNIESTVGGGASIAAGDVRIARGATIDGFAHIMTAKLTVDGRIDGTLTANAERVVINGEVTGDVKAAAQQIVLGPGAKIGGSLTYSSIREVTKGEGATIGGAVTRGEPGAADIEELRRVGRGASIFGSVVIFLAALGCGALFLAIAPIFSVEASDRIKSTPWAALGLGLAGVIGLPIVALLFILTIVGLPVGLMLFALYPFALLLGFVVGTVFVGNAGASLLRRPPPPTIAAAVGYFAIALALVMLVAKAPAIGGLLLCVLVLLGVGALEVELYRRMKGTPHAPRTASAR